MNWIEDHTDYICPKCGARIPDEVFYIMENRGMKMDYCPVCGEGDDSLILKSITEEEWNKQFDALKTEEFCNYIVTGKGWTEDTARKWAKFMKLACMVRLGLVVKDEHHR